MPGRQAGPLLTKLTAIISKAEVPLPDSDESYLSAQIRYAYQQGQINASERDQLQTVADLCWEAIQVDEFSSKTRMSL